MKQKHLYILFLLVLAIITIPFSCNHLTESPIDNPKNEILLRKIGHEVLISSNDKTSKVVPIKIISENEFQISFENKFAFAPDSLINIVKKNISKSTFPKEYSVSVQKCSNDAIVYGFHIAADSSKNIITCKGRNMPLDCYVISFKFASKTNSIFNKYFFVVILFFAVLVFFLIKFKKVKIKNETIITNEEEHILIGKYFFFFQKNQLQFENEKIALTPKESKLLHILSSSPNEIIDRNTLQKEIWENEGVIVTRSLDMFISKLRKKLEKDSSITIVNIHSVGYKLEIKN
ncbi:helix-turn-helix domain-containing protein [Flavobacterium sp.]|uniref:winged helix-turn-helix domain-containing protein n=1 Tax=Flavobacterium sp. TaxID=239 RepID=UPI00262AFE86|nr:helix-turn-helix domain-containing protein [Flavobacterium sp.]